MSYGGRLEAFGTVPSGTQVSVTNDAGAASFALTAGTHTPTSLLAHLIARCTAVLPPLSGSWSGSLSTGASGTGLVTLNCTGTWSMTFTTAELGTMLGFVGDIASRSSAATGTQNARGLWLPKVPMTIAGHPSRAPKVTDARSTVGPTGRSVTLKGTSKYRHREIKWTHITNAQTYEGAATTTYASLQQWVDDTQFGDGHSWFRPGSPFQVYWSNSGTDSIVGSDLNSGSGPTYGWTIQPALASFEPERATEQGLLLYWTFSIPELVSEG
jgi:hypothetical protein